MNTNPVEQAVENRNNFPADELWQHIDKWVAWSRDRTKIIAASSDLAELEALVKRAGLEISDTQIEFITDPDVAFLGGE